MYYLVYCDCCNNIDSSANTDTDEHGFRKHNVKCLVGKKLCKDTTIKLMDKYFKKGRISSKTLLLPSDKTLVRTFLQKYNMLKPDDDVHDPLVIWSKLWLSIDYIIENSNTEDTDEFKNHLLFVNEMLR